MRKLLNCIALIILVMSVSLPVVSAEVKNLDLESAINIAKEQNQELKLATLNLEKAKLEYQESKANNLLEQSRYNELEAEINLRSAQNTYQDTNYQVVNNTIEQYTSLWLSGLDLKIKDKKVELEKRLLEEAKAQYQIGDIGSVDLLEQENAYKDAQFNLETARDDYLQSIREFKTTLGLGEEELVLSDLEYTGSWQITEDEAVNIALEKSVNLQLKNDELKLTKIDLERAEVFSAELDKKIKQIAVEIARVEKESTREEVINTTREAYYQFKQAVKNLELKKERLTEAEEKYNLRKEQYEAGLITSTEVLEYEVNMMETKYDYLSAIADCYLKEQALRQKMNQEFGVLVNDSTEKK